MPTQPIANHKLSVFMGILLFAAAAASAQAPAQSPAQAPRSRPVGQSASAAKATPATQAPAQPSVAPAAPSFQESLAKYPGLLPALGDLFAKLQQGIQVPAPRAESRILPILPESTVGYAAIPNYGDVARQSLKIFREQLQASPVLRDWWEHGELGATHGAIEDGFDRFAQFHDFLGSELVIAGTQNGQSFDLLLAAEIRKPGLQAFLQQSIALMAGKAKPGVRVLNSQELAAAQPGAKNELLVLVRPDFVLAATDLATLRKFSSRVDDRHAREFAASPFGQRIQQEYNGGATLVAAADIHKLLAQAPVSTPQAHAALDRSGFAEMKYAVWSHKVIGGQSIGQAELSFSGPRRSFASWLAKPVALSNLDFVSSKSLLSGTIVLTNPTHMLDDLETFFAAAPQNQNPFAALPIFESALQVNLKNDLLAHLSGEITVELDSITPPQPGWKAVLKVNDSDALQQTLVKLFAAGHIQPTAASQDGFTCYTVHFPSQGKLTELDYAFVDSHLILAPTREAVAEAVRVHRSGNSLAKSPQLLAAVPAGRKLEASALLYQDSVAMYALQLQKAPPELKDLLGKATSQAGPSAVWVYGEESSIREASKSTGLDAGMVLVAAAVAIPNLLRARTAANEASAVGSLRSINTAQVAYSSTYPQRAFAPDLATLGPGLAEHALATPAHAALLDASLAAFSCTGDAWCTKSGYNFRVSAVCKVKHCAEYVVLATPVDAANGTRNFCSTSEGVIHVQPGAPLSAQPTAAQCRAWPALK